MYVQLPGLWLCGEKHNHRFLIVACGLKKTILQHDVLMFPLLLPLPIIPPCYCFWSLDAPCSNLGPTSDICVSASFEKSVWLEVGLRFDVRSGGTLHANQRLWSKARLLSCCFGCEPISRGRCHILLKVQNLFIKVTTKVCIRHRGFIYVWVLTFYDIGGIEILFDGIFISLISISETDGCVLMLFVHYLPNYDLTCVRSVASKGIQILKL